MPAHLSLIAAMFFAFCGVLKAPGRTLFAVEPFRIEIVDAENGWPVPLVELRTTHHVRFVSDNAGRIAFDLPEMMDRETWFTIEGHGYTVAKDGFGYRGVRLVPRAGETHRLAVKRQLPAKRLGRITGGGLFSESQKLGEELDWKEQGILGCDSVQNAVHNGRLLWGWGDTTLPGYPLGRFHMIGATTDPQPLESFEPPIRLQYDYFLDDSETPRNVAELPGEGPTWLGGYISLPTKAGGSRLCATYAKIKPPLDAYEMGLCVWNDQQRVFERQRVLWSQSSDTPKPPLTLTGHTVRWQDDEGQAWILFGDPFPTIRCRATFEAWADPQTWQTLEPQSRVPTRTGEPPIQPHRGAIAWNAYRNKWVTVFTQMKGESSMLGELWYAEADSPQGPWADAIHVVTHNQYSFYNPQLHAEFTPAGSPILLFEATYTTSFSGNRQPTPKYDYNQILYRLDLDELFPAATTH